MLSVQLEAWPALGSSLNTGRTPSKHILHLIYTAETPGDARRSALESLGAGHVPVIVAIGCLDEGVDVPTVDKAIILASSSNKRQFIQRRGRITSLAA